MCLVVCVTYFSVCVSGMSVCIVYVSRVFALGVVVAAVYAATMVSFKGYSLAVCCINSPASCTCGLHDNCQDVCSYDTLLLFIHTNVQTCVPMCGCLV